MSFFSAGSVFFESRLRISIRNLVFEREIETRESEDIVDILLFDFLLLEAIRNINGRLRRLSSGFNETSRCLCLKNSVPR